MLLSSQTSAASPDEFLLPSFSHSVRNYPTADWHQRNVKSAGIYQCCRYSISTVTLLTANLTTDSAGGDVIAGASERASHRDSCLSCPLLRIRSVCNLLCCIVITSRGVKFSPKNVRQSLVLARSDLRQGNSADMLQQVLLWANQGRM